jgi:hypothetical protein
MRGQSEAMVRRLDEADWLACAREDNGPARLHRLARARISLRWRKTFAAGPLEGR